MEIIRQWHTLPKPRGNGWADIGYHYVIEADGKIRHGRDARDVGAHAFGRNHDSIGICLVGNFSPDHGKPTDAQINSAAALYHNLCSAYSRRLRNEPHRRGQNACPGPGLDWEAFVSTIEQTCPAD